MYNPSPALNKLAVCASVLRTLSWVRVLPWGAVSPVTTTTSGRCFPTAANPDRSKLSGVSHEDSPYLLARLLAFSSVFQPPALSFTTHLCGLQGLWFQGHKHKIV